VKLPQQIQKFVKEYNKVGDPNRNEYLWKWIFRGTQIFTGDRINKKYLSKLLEVKLLLFILDTFFDDITDKYELRNRKLLEEILKVPFQQKYIEFNKLNKKEKKCVKFTIKIWNRIDKIIKKFPRYQKFKDIFEYDFSQLFNTLKYSYLVNQNYYLLNKTENWLYLPHSMLVVMNITLELMCSPKFNIQELAKLREVAWCAQNMSRIGNWVSTWEREITEGDFTSGVFVHALDSGIITIDDLIQGDKSEIIKKIKEGKIEEKLLKKWEQNYITIRKLIKDIKSINIKQKLLALQKIIFFHLTSRGYK